MCGQCVHSRKYTYTSSQGAEELERHKLMRTHTQASQTGGYIDPQDTIESQTKTAALRPKTPTCDKTPGHVTQAAAAQAEPYTIKTKAIPWHPNHHHLRESSDSTRKQPPPLSHKGPTRK